VDLNYIEELRRRGKESKVYQKHQAVGLELALILNDAGHKALYIKLAKENDQDELLVMAKSVAQNANVKNKGAYFMRVLSEERKKKMGKNERRNSNNR